MERHCSLAGAGHQIHWVLMAALALCAMTGQRLPADEIWNGPSIGFTNLDGSDPQQAGNQDRITSNVWLTRSSIEGLYNAKSETTYTHSLSPVNTAWAYGELANYSSLVYQNWEK